MEAALGYILVKVDAVTTQLTLAVDGVGNAVPVMLARKIAEHLLPYIKDSE